MSDIYKVAVALQMTSNAAPILGALASHLMHAHHQVKQLTKGLNDTTGAMSRLKLAVGGGLAIAGGSAALAVVGKMVDKGNELIKIQQNMAQAGVKAVEVQEAYAKAWELTGKYTNIGAADALKIISEARMTFGSQHDATHHAEDFVKMTSFLKAYQGGAHGKGAASFEAEAIAAMKSGEIAGKIDPKDMAEHVKQLTAMRVAYGDQLKIGQYLTAQRAGGVALRNVSDDFRYGIFPALVQENGSNAGVMIMTAFNKLVAGTGNKLEALSAMSSLGLLDESKVTHHPLTGKVTRVEMGAVKGDKEFAVNPGEWVEKYLKPALDKKTSSSVEQAQWVSKILPDRNAAKAVTEMLQQWPKLVKDAQMMLQARKSLNEGSYLNKSWEGQKQAFETQWENFVQALGAPLVGAATENLRRVNETMSGWAQWAGKPEMAGTVEAIGKGIAVLGGALVGGGAVALLAALGPAGWIATGLIAATAAAVAFREPLDAADAALDKFAKASWEWVKSVSPSMDAIKAGATALIAEIGSWPGRLSTAIAEMGAALVTAISDMLKSLFGKLNPFSKTAYEGGGGFGGLIQKASFSSGGGANDNFGTGGADGVFGGGGLGGSRGGAGLRHARGVISRANPEMVAYIREAAIRNGVNPDIALRIAASEGLGGSIPGVRMTPGDKGTSFGPFQLHLGGRGSLGTEYMRATGHHPGDPRYWKEQIDFALRYAGKNRTWAPWFGRGPAGVGTHEGFGYKGSEAPTAGAPPRRKEETHVHNVYIDGEKIERHVTRRMVAKAKFPTSVGGTDNYGVWHGPGTAGTKVA